MPDPFDERSARIVNKIVSGGQTGVDRAGLDVAIQLGIDHGGWCPKGRRAEDGRIPGCYQLAEADSDEYAFRTERNVVDSDGTLILFFATLRGGTELTYRLARSTANRSSWSTCTIPSRSAQSVSGSASRQSACSTSPAPGRASARASTRCRRTISNAC